ncbi:dnaJ [Rosa sericea]
MSSPSAFSFKVGAGANNPSRSRSKQNASSTEAKPFCSVSDGISNMEIDNDMCFVFGSSRFNSNSNFNSGGHNYLSGNMDKAKVVSEVCMKMKVESETESEQVETNACNVANSKCQGENVSSVFSSNRIATERPCGDNCESSERVVFGSESKNLCTSGFEDMKGKTFPFSVEGSSVRAKPQRQRREKSRTKNRMKVGHDVFVITQSCSTPSVKEVDVPSTYASHETCEACAEFRIRGNEAHCNNDFLKAQEYYTLGIVSIRASERSECCHKRLSLCYRDRAAARVSLGRIREALADALMAIQLYPGFPEDRVRAANCHLLLGEVEHALKYFNECLESKNDVYLDRRVVIECVDGIKKAQKVVECTNRSATLLERRTTEAALSALGIISEALLVSIYSEKLLEMKADTLYLLRRYEEAIQVCEQSFHSAEINCFRVESMDGSGCNYPFARLWRWVFISKSYFQLGRFGAALSFVEQVRSIQDKYGSRNMESSISAAVTIRELLSHKTTGNEAFKAGRYTEAAEQYTIALSRNIGSRPFASICLCNRAAAHQALGQIMDAIADCSLAIALDENYGKAVSRRAALHEMIRDYVQAASDIQRLVSILEKQADEKAKESTSEGSSNACAKKLQQARRRLPSMKEKAKKGIPMDFNLILGIKPSDTSSNIKKAYRMAALKHHPDKAGQFLGRNGSQDEGRLWKEISAEVQKDADRLFKMIGEAYEVLSDPSKRSKYDLEEDMRKAANERKEQSSRRKPSDFQSPNKTSSCREPSYFNECPSRPSSYRRSGFYRSPFERTCPDERESWKSYG